MDFTSILNKFGNVFVSIADYLGWHISQSVGTIIGVLIVIGIIYLFAPERKKK